MVARRGPIPAEGRWLYDLIRRLDTKRRGEVLLLVTGTCPFCGRHIGRDACPRCERE